MGRTDNKLIPISTRTYNATSIKLVFSANTFETLRFRALHNNCSPDGYIKRILNRYIELNTLPPLGAFNEMHPATLHHPPDAVTLASPYPPIYLRYIDTLIETLPVTYSTHGRTRRRMLETLVLIDLFN